MSDKNAIKVEPVALTRKDFVPGNEVRWCPGCGDYSVLAQVQKMFPEMGIKREDFAVISGIGCSSRFPYYMDTYGFHTIHGRATAIASGVKLANPALSVWVVTGDGDGFSIGGNHMIHLLRRNIDINVLLFNNRIYGLTKGQYSPTSLPGAKTKSSPFGSIDNPFIPASVAFGAEASFIARAIDVDVKNMQDVLMESHQHKGTSFVEIYQNCVIFNDGAFADVSNKKTRPDHALFVKHGEPMVFGADQNKGIIIDGSHPKVVDIGKEYPIERILVHDKTNPLITNLLLQMTLDNHFPTPFGVLRQVDKPTYDEGLISQIDAAKEKLGEGGLEELLALGDVWEV
jgi:2-oxoglutarate/2-oxoacid ferredoxin oxidoreductase subunit beta